MILSEEIIEYCKQAAEKEPLEVKRPRFRLFFNYQPKGYAPDYVIRQPDNKPLYLRALFCNPSVELDFIMYLYKTDQITKAY